MALRRLEVALSSVVQRWFFSPSGGSGGTSGVPANALLDSKGNPLLDSKGAYLLASK